MEDFVLIPVILYSLFATLICAIFLGVAYIALDHINGWHLFYPDRNPYRRYCKKCGQCQIVQSWDWNSPGWWEVQGEIKDESCKCHKYSEYHG